MGKGSFKTLNHIEKSHIFSYEYLISNSKILLNGNEEVLDRTFVRMKETSYNFEGIGVVNTRAPQKPTLGAVT